jgi:hypothetical protein
MTRLQALTLLRDAVQMTKGVHSNLWYDGPNEHCTIGALTQVGVDCGFPIETAQHMIHRFINEAGEKVKREIVQLTDATEGSPKHRRKVVLNYLENEIAKEAETAPVVPNSPAEIVNDVVVTREHLGQADASRDREIVQVANRSSK